jgi:hypothetical protein
MELPANDRKAGADCGQRAGRCRAAGRSLAGLPAGVYAVLPWSICHQRAGCSALRAGMERSARRGACLAAEIELRARAWIKQHGPDFPGDLATGRLGESEEERERFEEFANEAACPALDPATGRCDVYAWRPHDLPRLRSAGAHGRWGNGAGPLRTLLQRAPAKWKLPQCEMAVPHQLEAGCWTSWPMQAKRS